MLPKSTRRVNQKVENILVGLAVSDEYHGMSKRSKERNRKRQRQQAREDRAIEAIICATLRGWGQKEWERCFELMDRKKQQSLV